MLTRDLCYFCREQLDDKEEVLQGNGALKGVLAHRRCVVSRPKEKLHPQDCSPSCQGETPK